MLARRWVLNSACQGKFEWHTSPHCFLFLYCIHSWAPTRCLSQGSMLTKCWLMPTELVSLSVGPQSLHDDYGFTYTLVNVPLLSLIRQRWWNDQITFSKFTKIMSQEVYVYPVKCVLLLCEQERSGCKLQMIQDGEYLTAPQKPLKIIGERDACQVHA